MILPIFFEEGGSLRTKKIFMFLSSQGKQNLCFYLKDSILFKVFSLQIPERESMLERRAEIGALWDKMNHGGGWLGSLC